MGARVEENATALRRVAMAPARWRSRLEPIGVFVTRPQKKRLADLARPYASAEFLDAIEMAEGESDLANSSAHSRGVHHHPRLIQADSQRLLAEDMLVIGKGGNRLLAVNHVRAADGDRIDVVPR